jgi:hypothetical protein
VIEQVMMCTTYISNCYFFVEIIDNKKLEESNEANDDVYIMYVKTYGIRTCSELGR